MKFLKILLLLIIITTSLPANELNKDNFGHAFIAAGLLYGLGSIRVGYDHWEIGMLNSNTYGFAKFIAKDYLYGGFGFMFDNNISPGIFGAAGFHKTYWKILTFRFEFNTSVSLEAFIHEEVLLGLSIHF